METQSALIRTNGAVELHTIARIDVHLALVVSPRHAEHDHTLWLNEALDAFDDVLDDLGLFSDYYGSPEWFDDHEADEKGELPESLKRGVLSEDAPYDALIELRSTALRMLEIATDTLYIV